MNKKLIFILFVFLFTVNLFSQVTDTCFVGDTSIYHVKNQQKDSWLYWDISDGGILSENPTQSDSIVVFWNVNEGIYNLSVFEQTDNNCSGTIAETEIMIIETDIDTELEIPNVFTPNGDNQNDYFTIKTDNILEKFFISIQNRWGQKVFENYNIMNSWDGTINGGKSCNTGIYYYVIQYQSKGKIEQRNGFVHLYR